MQFLSRLDMDEWAYLHFLQRNRSVAVREYRVWHRAGKFFLFLVRTPNPTSERGPAGVRIASLSSPACHVSLATT